MIRREQPLQLCALSGVVRKAAEESERTLIRRLVASVTGDE